jgi:hypothetical protein
VLWAPARVAQKPTLPVPKLLVEKVAADGDAWLSVVSQVLPVFTRHGRCFTSNSICMLIRRCKAHDAVCFLCRIMDEMSCGSSSSCMSSLELLLSRVSRKSPSRVVPYSFRIEGLLVQWRSRRVLPLKVRRCLLFQDVGHEVDQCSICMEAHHSASGLQCGGGHFICHEDVNSLVRFHASPERLRRHRGQIPCPWVGQGEERCEHRWHYRELRQFLDGETHVVFVEGLVGLLDPLLQGAARGGGAGREGEGGEGGRGDARVEEAVAYVMEEILSLHCPACHAVFADFDVSACVWIELVEGADPAYPAAGLPPLKLCQMG